jgi:hypothetical protein
VDEELVFLLKKTDTLNQRRRIAGKRVKEEKRRILARKTEIACKNLQIDVYVEPTVRTHQFRTHPQILEEERERGRERLRGESLFFYFVSGKIFGGKEKAFLLGEENVTDAAFGDGNEGGGSGGSSDSGSECVGISAFL